ncbi:hypothetical protein K1719_022328 [Acacia pycnantha]|nr:hypothetical protein K1719_022328 [Acacia pycnantha]
MESVKQTCKRVLGRCKRCTEGGSSYNIISKVQESLGKSKKNKKQLAPEGCFWVYVGPQRERFLMKIEVANHPMFNLLIDDAETKFGYRSEGPIWLPCDVNLFCEAVAEMEMEIEEDNMSSASSSWACSVHNQRSYPNSLMHSPLSYLSSPKHTAAAEYELLTPSTFYV